MAEYTGKYKCVNRDSGYEGVLIEGAVYDGIEEPGIFPGERNRYLRVFNAEGVAFAAAHITRFERVS